MSIIYEKKERIAIITINRPEVRNALDFEAIEALNKAWIDFRDDLNLWVAIITGAGDKAFSAGADVRKIGEFYSKLTSAERLEMAEKEPGLGGITRNLEIWKPIIAAINGYCLAGGMEIALSCDIRIASENAVFGLTEARLGIMPGAGGTQRLPRLIPLAKALEMMLLAKRIDAQEALQIGLVNKVVPLPELMPTAMETAQTICERGPLAVRAIKKAVLRGLEIPLREGLLLEQYLAEPLRQSEDAKEGIRAFIEKRKPEFKGK
ncbi:MAG: enoyl-CoA hydratase/isomerase family protein [Candidatus Lokiarchaeia archaeon]